MKRFYLVRHGQTDWNGENRLQGHSDQPLSLLGQEQARQVAKFFASRQVKKVFSSHLMRSRQTAEVIARHNGNGHPAVFVIDPALAEMNLGAWEGLTPDEIDAKFEGAYAQWRQMPSAVVIPQAEPVQAFRTRVREVVRKLVEEFEEGEYVVVSHGGVIASVLADLLGADYDAILRRVRLDNASITAVEFGSAIPHVLWINATVHLEGSVIHPPESGWY